MSNAAISGNEGRRGIPGGLCLNLSAGRPNIVLCFRHH